MSKESVQQFLDEEGWETPEREYWTPRQVRRSWRCWIIGRVAAVLGIVVHKDGWPLGRDRNIRPPKIIGE